MRYSRQLPWCLLVAALVLIGAVPAWGQSSSSYSITKSVVAGGGGSSSSGSYAVSGTAGQAAAGPSSASSYEVRSGFWGGGAGAASLIFAHLKVYLEGPYASGGSMNTDLLGGGYLPASQPYDSSAFEGTPMSYDGTESVSSVPSGVVDWVLVELRTGTAASDSVDTRAAFLKADGTVVDTDGTSQVAFSGLSPGDYYVVVRHRNHLPAMSASTITISGSPSLYDFTSAQSQSYNGGATEVESGTWGLFASDADANGQVQTADKNNVWNGQVGTSGYQAADFDLDGQVQTSDKNLFWNPNVGEGTAVPEN